MDPFRHRPQRTGPGQALKRLWRSATQIDYRPAP